MKVLISSEEFGQLTRNDPIKLQCLHCNEAFFIEKYRVLRAAERGTGKYCSQTCARHARRTSQEIHCANCNTIFRKHGGELKRTGNHFCSRSCSAQCFKIAIELNGPLHYFPIFGPQKLAKIQAADAAKQLEIPSIGYDLQVIDISAHGYFKEVKVILEEYYLRHILPLLEK